ncbi:MAG: polyprenyl synthetase family protein [Bacillota bacterium]
MTVEACEVIARRAREIDAELARLLPEHGVPEQLRAPMEYAVFSGGKRLRPIMTLEMCAGLGGDERQALPFACALEMVHTYSLIHDDLPCMDNDDFRRGKLTVHRVFGEALAVLAGDALLTHAFWIVASASTTAGLRVEIARELAYASGPAGMAGGQVLDMQLAPGRDGEFVLTAHRMKTAAMFSAAVRIGALIAGADEVVLGLVSRFGDTFGLCYQIRDDLLDLKKERERFNYARAVGAEQARRMLRELHGTACDLLGVIPLNESFFLKLMEELFGRYD